MRYLGETPIAQWLPQSRVSLDCIIFIDQNPNAGRMELRVCSKLRLAAENKRQTFHAGYNQSRCWCEGLR